MEGTVLFKVGGSLLDWPEFPARLGASFSLFPGSRLILVVGGGTLVDVVRVWDETYALGDEAAHDLALWGLEVTARLVARLVPGLEVVDDAGSVRRAWDRGRTPVVSPRRFLEALSHDGATPLATTWDTTSDSIAARVAESLGAGELVLLKSAPAGPARDRREAARLGLVDPHFPAASSRFRRVRVVNLRAHPLRLDTLE